MIGIVGAGIGGLALSRFLDEEGLDHVVLEAAERPGGVIRSSRVDGRVLDHGPQRTRVTPGVEAMIRAAGLEEETIPLAAGLPLFVYRAGALRRVPLGLRELLAGDLLSPRARLRVLLEPLTAGVRGGVARAGDPRGNPEGTLEGDREEVQKEVQEGVQEGVRDGGRAGVHGDRAGEPEEARREETVEAFFTRKFGGEAYRNLLGPLFGGLYGSDPGEMYVRHALSPLLRDLSVSRSILLRFLLRSGGDDGDSAPRAVSFGAGMGRLPEALCERQGGRVKLATPVERLQRTGERWRLEGPDGALEADHVVLTCAADAAARLLEEALPVAARRLASLRYNPLAVVHLDADTPLHGLGCQLSFEERLRTRGLTWNASAFGRPRLYTAFLGGARDPELPALGDAEIGRVACEDFLEITGYPARPLAVSRTRMPAWDRSWRALDGLRLPPGLHLMANFESRVGVPGRVERARRLARELASRTSSRARRTPARA